MHWHCQVQTFVNGVQMQALNTHELSWLQHIWHGGFLNQGPDFQRAADHQLPVHGDKAAYSSLNVILT